MIGSESQTRGGAAVWELASTQHGQVTYAQLVALGYSRHAIAHRIERRRLHPTRPRVYSLGRPTETREAEWMAAVLTGGPDTRLSDGSAAAHWKISEEVESAIHVTVPPGRQLRQPLLVVHRRSVDSSDDAICDGIPVTSPIRTLIDIALTLKPWELENAVNEADRHDLVDPETLRAAVGERTGVRGIARLRRLLDRRTFSLTDSELERRFLRLTRRSTMPRPLTQQRLHGFRADFFWPELGLVVETDGLRYHRTPAQQARDRLRDQAFTAAGLTVLRFTHAQVRYEPDHVVATLRRVARRLAGVTSSRP